MIRIDSPTCGAASPTPGAAYIVCAMLSMRVLRVPLRFSTGSAGRLRTSSGNLRIRSRAIDRVCLRSSYQRATALERRDEGLVGRRLAYARRFVVMKLAQRIAFVL